MDKDEFLKQALKANEGEASKANLADLSDVNSTVYQGIKLPPTEKQSSIPVKPTIDEEGLPVLTQIRTFQGDVGGAVKTDGLSIAKVVIQEETKKREGAPIKSKTNFALFFLSLVLLGAVGAGGYYFYFLQNKEVAEVVVPPEIEPITTDKKTSIDIKNLTQSSFLSILKERKLENEPQGTIKKVEVLKSEQKVFSKEFFEFLNSRIPEKLSNALYEKYYLGIFYGKTTPSPFLLLFLNSNEVALPGLLEWEKTIAYDLEPIFGRNSGTTTPITADFKDRLIENRDVRAIGEEGKDLFFYTILDQNIIIITSEDESLRELLRRFRESKIRS